MNFLDPARPMLPGTTDVPLMLNYPAILPVIYVIPFEGRWSLSAFLPVEGSATRAFHIEVPTNALSDFFTLWETDPERVITDYFKWLPPKEQKRQEQNVLTLADLGL